jgi:hypothetical protein
MPFEEGRHLDMAIAGATFIALDGYDPLVWYGDSNVVTDVRYTASSERRTLGGRRPVMIESLKQTPADWPFPLTRTGLPT